jgi:hypothetical protein
MKQFKGGYLSFIANMLISKKASPTLGQQCEPDMPKLLQLPQILKVNSEIRSQYISDVPELRVCKVY